MSDSALLTALSGFWHRFFEDTPDLNAFYTGVETLAAQFYVDLMHEVLGASTVDAALGRPEQFRVWHFRDSDVTRLGTEWAVKARVPWQNLRYLQDEIVVPTTILDCGREFNLTGDGYVTFSDDPRVLLPGAARRSISVEVGGILQVLDSTGVVPEDRVVLQDGREFVVSYVTPSEIGFAPEHAVVASIPGISWSVPAKSATVRTGDLVVARTARITDYAVWAVDARVDEFALYRNRGNLISERRPSTETYRNFILGVTRLYAQGPTMRRLEEALTAAAGLPLARRTGEVVVSKTATELVTTDRTYYAPAELPFRDDITVGTVLQAFQTLTPGVTILDELSAPNWWYGITIPRTIMPGAATEARQVSPALYPNLIGEQYAGTVGAVDVFIGDKWHRTGAFTLMNRLLKYNFFCVKLAPALDRIPGTINQLQRLIEETRPAGTFPYTWPDSPFADEAFVSDDLLSLGAGMSMSDSVTAPPAWVVGTGTIGAKVGVTGTIGGDWPLAVGGAGPSDNAPGIADRPLHITKITS